jgi:hypothetical protein
MLSTRFVLACVCLVCGCQWGLWVGWVHCVCGLEGFMCVLGFLLVAVVRFKGCSSGTVLSSSRSGGVGGSSHTVVDQAEPQSSTLWQLSESV